MSEDDLEQKAFAQYTLARCIIAAGDSSRTSRCSVDLRARTDRSPPSHADLLHGPTKMPNRLSGFLSIRLPCWTARLHHAVPRPSSISTTRHSTASLFPPSNLCTQLSRTPSSLTLLDLILPPPHYPTPFNGNRIFCPCAGTPPTPRTLIFPSPLRFHTLSFTILSSRPSNSRWYLRSGSRFHRGRTGGDCAAA